MDYVRLGRTGLKVSRLCLGAMTYGTKEWRDWVLDEADSRPFIRRALELGINFIDTADIYSNGASEEIVGRALKDFAKRDDIVLATKVYNPMGPGPNDRGLSRKHIMSAIDASLQRLQTDYVDLYQCHRYDEVTPLPETLISNSSEVWLKSRFERIPPGVLSNEAFAEYLRAFQLPGSIHASCEDYRAGATIDLTHDELAGPTSDGEDGDEAVGLEVGDQDAVSEK